MSDQAASNPQLLAAMTVVFDFEIAAFQGRQYLIVKTANPSHRKHSGHHPLFFSAGNACSIAPDAISGVRAPMLPNFAAALPWECFYRDKASRAIPGWCE